MHQKPMDENCQYGELYVFICLNINLYKHIDYLEVNICIITILGQFTAKLEIND